MLSVAPWSSPDSFDLNLIPSHEQVQVKNENEQMSAASGFITFSPMSSSMVEATVVGSDTIQITWEVPGAAWYMVEWSGGGLGDMLAVPTLNQHPLTGLPSDTVITITITSSTLETTTTSATTWLETPIVSENVPETKHNDIMLTWGLVSGADEYVIERKDSDGSTTTFRTSELGGDYGTVSSDSIAWATIRGLEPGETYMFTVKAIRDGGFLNDGNESDCSDSVTITTFLETPTVTEDKSTRTANSVTLEWEHVKDADEYEIKWQRFDEAAGWVDAGDRTVDVVGAYVVGDSVRVTIGGLDSNTEYQFHVRALHKGGRDAATDGNESKWTGEEKWTPESVSVLTLLETPKNLDAEATPGSSHNSITLTWDGVDEANLYQIRWREVDKVTNDPLEDWQRWNPVAELTVPITGLAPNKKYEFQIRALIIENDALINRSQWSGNGGGSGSGRVFAETTKERLQLKEDSWGFFYVTETDKIYLFWGDATDTEGNEVPDVSYLLEWSSTGKFGEDGDTGVNGSAEWKGTWHSINPEEFYAKEGLGAAANGKFYFRVTALPPVGSDDYEKSDPKWASKSSSEQKMLPPAIPVISTLSIDVGKQEVKLEWNLQPNPDNMREHVLYYQKVGATNWEESDVFIPGDAGERSISISQLGLETGAYYVFRLDAINTHGIVRKGQPSDVTLPPIAIPRQLEAPILHDAIIYANGDSEGSMIVFFTHTDQIPTGHYLIEWSHDKDNWDTVVGHYESVGSGIPVTVPKGVLNYDPTKEYWVRVTAIPSSSDPLHSRSVPSNVVKAVHSNVYDLTAPTRGRMITGAQTAIEFQVNAVVGAQGYEWEITDENGDLVQDGTSDSPRFVIEGLEPDTEYSCKVRAVGKDNEGKVVHSDFSKPFDVTTAAAVDEKGVELTDRPIIIDAIPNTSEGTVTITWTDLGDDYIYAVFKDGVSIKDLDGNMRWFQDSEFIDNAPDPIAEYAVRAYNVETHRVSVVATTVAWFSAPKIEFAGYEYNKDNGKITLMWDAPKEMQPGWKYTILVNGELSDIPPEPVPLSPGEGSKWIWTDELPAGKDNFYKLELYDELEVLVTYSNVFWVKWEWLAASDP